MFLRIVTLVRGWVGCLSTDRSLLAEAQPSPNAKPLRVKSTQVSPKAVRNPVKQKPKRKAKAVLLTTQVASPKAVKKSAPKTSGQTGKSKTPVRQTPQLAKSAPKAKRSLAK